MRVRGPASPLTEGIIADLANKGTFIPCIDGISALRENKSHIFLIKPLNGKGIGRKLSWNSAQRQCMTFMKALDK